jgi:hypothetical protein
MRKAGSALVSLKDPLQAALLARTFDSSSGMIARQVILWICWLLDEAPLLALVAAFALSQGRLVRTVSGTACLSRMPGGGCSRPARPRNPGLARRW